MELSEAKSLCKDLLVLSHNIEFSLVAEHPGGRVMAIESRIPIGNKTPSRHFNIFTNMMKDIVEVLEEQYGRCNYFLYNFSQGQMILFPTKKNVVVIGTKPLVSPALVTMVADRLREYIPY